jgi:hypothetical protein
MAFPTSHLKCEKCGRTPDDLAKSEKVIRFSLSAPILCGSCMPPQEPEHPMEMPAAYLNEMEAPARLAALQKLRELTTFCWDCGQEYLNGHRICACTDEL